MCQRQVWVLRFFVYQLLGKFGLCFFCQILFIFPPFQPHFGSRVSPCVRDKVVRLPNPTAYDLCCINTPSSFPTKTVQLARSPTFIGRPDFTKYKGEVLIFIFWTKVVKKDWFYVSLSIFVHIISHFIQILDLGFYHVREKSVATFRIQGFTLGIEGEMFGNYGLFLIYQFL